jgi:small subunit ribosomal protein S16
MVRLRLRKVGSKAQISFRLVAAEREHPRDGRFLEALGSYNPRTNPATITLDEARIYHWLKVGAQPSESAEKVLKSAGTLERYARFKAGEEVEKLVAEAKDAADKRNTHPKTSFSMGQKGKASKKQKGEKKA